MNNRIATTIEQSQELIKLGIDINTADMVYVGCEYLTIRDGVLEEDDMPAWSLGALLELLPKDEKISFDLTFGHYDNNDDFIKEWYMSYIDTTTSEENPEIKTATGSNAFDIIFVCLLENKEL